MHPAAARVLLGALGCSLLVATIELARCPQLVAFVPATQAVSALNNSPVQLGDALYPANPPRDTLTPGAHIVQARAIMPSASQMKPFASRAHMQQRRKTAAVGELRAASSGPGVSSQRSRQLAIVGTTSEPGAPQVIVFTAWEQIEAPANQAVADYETRTNAGATTTQSAADNASPQNSAQASGDAPRQNNTQPDASHPAPITTQRRTTFTQLILRVAPDGATPSQPRAIPIGNGWFVIQL